MTDEELRTLVRDAIQRHLGGGANAPRGSELAARADEFRVQGLQPDPPWRAHPSFGKFLLPSGDEEGGPCLIEPAVRCNHCGFCQSYGH